MKSDFIPMTVNYEQPVQCCRCPDTTTGGIREYDANKVATEQSLCEACFLIVFEEYKAYLEQRSASTSS